MTVDGRQWTEEQRTDAYRGEVVRLLQAQVEAARGTRNAVVVLLFVVIALVALTLVQVGSF